MAFARKLAVFFVLALGGFAPAAQAIPFISLYFNPQTIDVGGTSRMQINLYDNAGTPITGASISGFTYPANVVNAAAPNVTLTGCLAATITAGAGSGSLSATGINIPFNGVCVLEVDVTASVEAVYTVTFPAGAFNGNTGPNSTDTTAQLAVTPPLVVTTTADSGPGSLRQAITDANDFCTTPYGGYPRIRFNIGGASPFVIQPATALPQITCDGMEIDGSTQPGHVSNTATDGTNNAVIPVQIDGIFCVLCDDGLYFATNGTVRGLAIHSFPVSAINAPLDAITVMGSYLGAKPGSLSMLGGNYGVISGADVQMGTSAPQDANLVTGNQIGVLVQGYAYIAGNLIGGDANGGPELANSGAGVMVNTTGYAPVYVSGNFIRYNGGAGIAVAAASTSKNTFALNSSSKNGGPGIDLRNDGPTLNDGAAFPFNYPVITSVQHVGADTLIEGYIKSSGGNAEVEFFHNSVRPPPSITEGEKPIGGASVSLDGSGYGTFSVTITGFLAENVSASAVIDTCGDGCVGSSEYSPPFGGAPTATVNPRSLLFQPRGISTTSAPQTVTLTNGGPGPLTFDFAAVSGDFAITTNCPAAPMANGASCTFDVTFTPLVAGGRSGQLTINTDAVGSPHLVSLYGTGETNPVPEVALVPGTLEFAPQRVDTESAMQFPTVVNVGTAPLVFGSITASGDFSVTLDFTSRVGPCVSELAPGASCELGVRFQPTAAGLREGAVTIESNAPASPATLRLVGTGVDTAPPRTLSIPANLVFDAQRVGTASPGRPVRITNNSATVASITDLSTSGDFSVSDTCTTIPARGSCSPLVTFLPTAEGERSGTLTIRSLSETLPYLVQLRGLGLFNPLPALAASISQAGFGNAFVGTAARITFELRNIGQVPVVVESLVPLGAFFVGHSCATIAVLGTCEVTVYFVPNAVGRHVGSLAIGSNAEGSLLRIDLSGTGCAIPSIAWARFGGLLCGAP